MRTNDADTYIRIYMDVQNTTSTWACDSGFLIPNFAPTNEKARQLTLWFASIHSSLARMSSCESGGTLYRGQTKDRCTLTHILTCVIIHYAT